MSQGSEKRIRNQHLTIRFSPDERAAIDAAAIRAGLTSGSYAREILLGAPTPRQVRRPPIERRELAKLLGQLGAIGNNVNQIARVANSGNGIDRVDIQDAIAYLRTMRDALMEALGRDA